MNIANYIFFTFYPYWISISWVSFGNISCLCLVNVSGKLRSRGNFKPKTLHFNLKRLSESKKHIKSLVLLWFPKIMFISFNICCLVLHCFCMSSFQTKDISMQIAFTISNFPLVNAANQPLTIGTIALLNTECRIRYT